MADSAALKSDSNVRMEHLIDGVHAIAVTVPVSPAARFSTRDVHQREYVLVRVTTADSDQMGWGYTYAGDTGAGLVAEVVQELIEPVLVGRPLTELEANWQALYAKFLLIGRRGAVLRALSAVDIACWDLALKNLGQPLHRILGGSERSVAAYGSGGYYRPGNPISNVAEEMQRYLDLGFQDFKIKFGGETLATDLARVEAAREVIGVSARLAVDVNNGWSNLAEAMGVIRKLEQYDIWWIEEPFSPDDIRSHIDLASRSPIPVATGEIEATHWGFAELIDRRAAQILQPDVCVAGGITPFLKIARSAESAGVPIAPHWNANVHAQLAAACPNCLTIEYFSPSEGIFNFEELVSERLVVSEGRVEVSQVPGVGISFDQSRIEFFASAGESGLVAER